MKTFFLLTAKSKYYRLATGMGLNSLIRYSRTIDKLEKGEFFSSCYYVTTLCTKRCI